MDRVDEEARFLWATCPEERLSQVQAAGSHEPGCSWPWRLLGTVPWSSSWNHSLLLLCCDLRLSSPLGLTALLRLPRPPLPLGTWSTQAIGPREAWAQDKPHASAAPGSGWSPGWMEEHVPPALALPSGGAAPLAGGRRQRRTQVMERQQPRPSAPQGPWPHVPA